MDVGGGADLGLGAGLYRLGFVPAPPGTRMYDSGFARVSRHRARGAEPAYTRKERRAEPSQTHMLPLVQKVGRPRCLERLQCRRVGLPQFLYMRIPL